MTGPPERFEDFDPDMQDALRAVGRGELTADEARQQLGIGRENRDDTNERTLS